MKSVDFTCAGALQDDLSSVIRLGSIYASADDYSPILRALLSGRLGMLNALGTHTVCAWSGSGCAAAFSPIRTQHWHYSITHWVEDDPTNGDGAFSSPGAFGFYPWIGANKNYYGSYPVTRQRLAPYKMVCSRRCVVTRYALPGSQGCSSSTGSRIDALRQSKEE